MPFLVRFQDMARHEIVALSVSPFVSNTFNSTMNFQYSDNSENQPIDENEQQFRADLASKIDRTAFDPKQDKEGRRRLRKKYRSLIGETEGLYAHWYCLEERD